MKIGYGCITCGLININYRNVTLKYVNDEKLLEIIQHNLIILDKMVEYNIENNIEMFRISSDIIPFGSSLVINKLKWWELFEYHLYLIGEKILKNHIRVSMHPGQYTVLNSLNDAVVNRSIDDLIYHTRFLDSLGVKKESKVVLHIGGIYNNKQESIERFINNYHRLDENVKMRLVIENDDKCFNVKEVLGIANTLDIPVVYDNLHNEINPYDLTKDDKYWINEVKKTWKKEDGIQKIHYAEQDPNKQIGSHSQRISLNKFLRFLDKIDREDVDIMLEVKDKNISAIKCINGIRKNKDIKYLEQEWDKYKYLILEKSQDNYNKINDILKDKNQYRVVEFYQLIEDSLDIPFNKENEVMALFKIWSNLEGIVTKNEEDKFLSFINKFQSSLVNKRTIKNYLYKLIKEKKLDNFLNSYFFTIE